MQEEKKPESERRPPSRRPKWWASLFMMIIIPAPLDVISFSFAAQSLLAPLAAVTLLLNAVLSPYFLGETLTNVGMFLWQGVYVFMFVVILFSLSYSLALQSLLTALPLWPAAP